MTRKGTIRLRLGAGFGLAALALTACTSGSAGGSSSQTPNGYTPGELNKNYAGTSIHVLMPPWGTVKSDLLAKFTEETGIKVDMESLDFDSIHDKIVTAEAGGQSPADVVEMDWTWVAQFGAAGWFTSLNDYLSAQQIKNSVGASIFVNNGKQIALPYNLDFRGTAVNMTMLNKAGITTPPETWDELITDAVAVKKAGIVTYPIGLPLSITEGSATPWYALVRGSGGDILTESGKAAFGNTDAGVKSLELIHTLYSQGMIDPGSIGLNDQQVGGAFNMAQSAILLSAGSGAMNQSTDPGKSNVLQDTLVMTHVPGMDNNTGATIGLQEALAIPKQSANKEAAAMFITWWMQTPQLTAIYEDPDLSQLPTTEAALSELSTSGKLQSGDSILKLLGNIQPVVKGGIPTWYSKFSTAVASTIQSVAIGTETAASGIAELEKKTNEIAAE